MTDAFRVLGLAPDADERAIKRAYAALLRAHRPDEDPAGFQRINEAYAQALDVCHGRVPPAWVALEDELEAFHPGEHGMAPPIGAPDAGPALQQDDIPLAADPSPGETPEEQQAALDALLEIAQQGRVRALERHLRGAFIYWSMDAKYRLAWQLVDRLTRDPVAMPDDCFDALMAFFGLDDVHAVRHLRHLTPLRAECMRRWNVRRSASVRSDGNPVDTMVMGFLREPFSWWNAPWYALHPSTARDVMRFLRANGHAGQAQQPPGIDPAMIAFWADLLALDPPINRARLTVFALRTLIGASVLALLAVWLGSDANRPASQVALEGFGYGVMIALAWLVLQVYNRWQGLRGPFEWPAWLVPGLAGATLVSIPFSEDGSATEVLSALTLLLPLWRDVHAWIRQRGSGAHDELNFGTGYILMGCTFVAGAFMFWLPNWAPAAIAMPLWGWQLWQMRKAHA